MNDATGVDFIVVIAGEIIFFASSEICVTYDNNTPKIAPIRNPMKILATDAKIILQNFSVTIRLNSVKAVVPNLGKTNCKSSVKAEISHTVIHTAIATNVYAKILILLFIIEVVAGRS